MIIHQKMFVKNEFLSLLIETNMWCMDGIWVLIPELYEFNIW